MPPKIKFTREDVINAAFEILQKDGLKALSARKIAQNLNSSVAPVYSCFESLDDLKYTLLRKAKELLFQYATKPYTDRVFLNMGTGIALFARDNCHLFRALFLTSSDSSEILDEFMETCKIEMLKDTRFTDLNQKYRDELLMKMWIFTHGLASLICVGLLEDDSQEYITKILSEVGSAVIKETFIKSGTINL